MLKLNLKLILLNKYRYTNFKINILVALYIDNILFISFSKAKINKIKSALNN